MGRSIDSYTDVRHDMSDETTITIKQDTRKRLREIAEELSTEKAEYVSMNRLLCILIAAWERRRGVKHK